MAYAEATQIVAVDARTGDQRYRAEAFLPVGDVAADDERVYVSLWQGAASFDTEDGSLVWWWHREGGLDDT